MAYSIDTVPLIHVRARSWQVSGPRSDARAALFAVPHSNAPATHLPLDAAQDSPGTNAFLIRLLLQTYSTSQ